MIEKKVMYNLVILYAYVKISYNDLNIYKNTNKMLFHFVIYINEW